MQRNYARYDKATGEIIGTLSVPDFDTTNLGLEETDDIGIVEVSENVSAGTHYYKNSIISEVPDYPGEGFSLDKTTFTWILDQEIAMAAMRVERDRRLAACDWTQVPDSPLSDDKKAEWASYRQALRDLPANTTDPTAVVWPEQP